MVKHTQTTRRQFVDKFPVNIAKFLKLDFFTKHHWCTSGSTNITRIFPLEITILRMFPAILYHHVIKQSNKAKRSPPNFVTNIKLTLVNQVPFPLKLSENRWFSNDFRGDKK